MDAFSKYITVLLLSICGMLVMVRGDVHYYEFVLKEKNFTRLCSTKSLLVVNETIPGPTIRVHKGDTVFVNVHNHGNYSLTIHWHGVKQPRNPWSDGTPYITQCPIQPRSNFTYQLIFSDEEGTVWWHAHTNWTRGSVHGAIVVLPAVGTSFPFPEPDGEEIIVLGDWFIPDANYVIEAELIHGGFSRLIPDCYTLNSQPGDLHICSNDTMYRWTVDYGKTYLLRLVSNTMDEFTYLAIAGHNLTVVGSDGAYVKPFATSFLMMGPGQTMDVLLTANQSIGGQYYIATRNYYTTTTVNPDSYTKQNSTGVLQYRDSSSDSEPQFPDTTLPYYLNYEAGIEFLLKFQSLASEEHPVDVPMNITTKMFITVSLNEDARQQALFLAGSLNNVSWVDPPGTVLEAYYRNMTDGIYESDFPDVPPTFYDFLAEYLGMNASQALMATKVKVLEYNEEVEIVVQSTNALNSSQNHPMHLHGYSFYVVGRGEGVFDPDEGPKGYNLVDPPCVNTAIVPKLGWFTLRFKANNPGTWLMHCHIEHHYAYGMNTVFIVKNGGTPETSMRDPLPYMPFCGSNSGYEGIEKFESTDLSEDFI